MSDNAYNFAAKGLGAGLPAQTTRRAPDPIGAAMPELQLSLALQALVRRHAHLFVDLIRDALFEKYQQETENHVIEKLKSLNLFEERGRMDQAINHNRPGHAVIDQQLRKLISTYPDLWPLAKNGRQIDWRAVSRMGRAGILQRLADHGKLTATEMKILMQQ